MDMVNTSISTDTSTKANGKTTFQTVKDKQSIQMEAGTMGNSWTTSATAKAFWHKKAKSSMATSSTTKWMVSEFYSCKTSKGTKGNGLTTKNTDSESTDGPMDVFITEAM